MEIIYIIFGFSVLFFSFFTFIFTNKLDILINEIKSKKEDNNDENKKIIEFLNNKFKEIFDKLDNKNNFQLKIKPYGRFGNNVIQIRNAIKIALQYNIPKIYFSDNSKYIDLTKKIKNGNSLLNNETISKLNDSGKIYFNAYDEINELIPNFNPNFDIDIVNKILRDYIFNLYHFVSPEYPCIHIRSGDIFNEVPHENYVIPPYDFYKIILDLPENKYKKFILVAEDRKNPIINKIINNYSNVIYEERSLTNTQEIILNNKKIIHGCGISTFVPQLISLSKGEKESISFDTDRNGFNTIKKEYYKNGRSIKTKKIKIENYIDKWNNTEDQINIVMDFKIKDNCNFKKLYKLLKF